MDAIWMSTRRQMDKEVVVHIHNGILFSYIKERIWVNSNEVDEIRAHHTEWSKSERGTQILYTNIYIRNFTEKAMAPHCRILAWKIPWMEELGRLQYMGSLRVGHDWGSSLSLFMHWRRKWQPTPGFLPGESQGRGGPVGCRLRGHTGSDRTDRT